MIPEVVTVLRDLYDHGPWPSSTCYACSSHQGRPNGRSSKEKEMHSQDLVQAQRIGPPRESPVRWVRWVNPPKVDRSSVHASTNWWRRPPACISA